MSRTKGSKNKPKPTLSDVKAMSKEERVAWLTQKESNLPTVSTVENTGVIEKRRRIRSTITPPIETETILSGVDSVKSVSINLEVEKVQKNTRVITGYVNIQKSRTGYYTGGDIHPTPESAKRVANENTVATIYVGFEVKR